MTNGTAKKNKKNKEDTEKIKINIAQQTALDWFLPFSGDCNGEDVQELTYNEIMEYLETNPDSDTPPPGYMPWSPFEGYDNGLLNEIIESHVFSLICVMTKFEKENENGK